MVKPNTGRCAPQSRVAPLACTLALLSTLLGPTPASAGEDGPYQRMKLCLTPSEMLCLLNSDALLPEEEEGCRDPFVNGLIEHHPNVTQQILIGRLRFPGTASSHQSQMFEKYEIRKSRYEGMTTNDCKGQGGLCISASEVEVGTDGSGWEAAEEAESLAFSHFHQSGWGAHQPYDIISQSLGSVLELDRKVNLNQYHPEVFMITTLREFGSYSHKWYAFRRNWDKAVDLSNATFAEWIDLAPWRMNVLTRMLGAQADRQSMPSNLIYTMEGRLGDGKHGQAELDEIDRFARDKYMKEQNGLGEESEVLALALERLRGMVHFSLFHRLTESWELLAHNFCWDMGYENYRPDKEITGLEAVRKSVGTDEEAAEIWDKLKERNKLDLALLEEAERIFDERMEKMKREKADGVLCNFLGRVKIMCASGDSQYNDE